MRVAVVLWLAVAGSRGDLLGLGLLRRAGEDIHAAGAGLQQRLEASRLALQHTDARFKDVEGYQQTTQPDRPLPLVVSGHRVVQQKPAVDLSHKVTGVDVRVPDGLKAGHSVLAEKEKQPKEGAEAGHWVVLNTEKRFPDRVNTSDVVLESERKHVGAAHLVIFDMEKKVPNVVGAGHSVVLDTKKTLPGRVNEGHGVLDTEKSVPDLVETGYRVLKEKEKKLKEGVHIGHRVVMNTSALLDTRPNGTAEKASHHLVTQPEQTTVIGERETTLAMPEQQTNPLPQTSTPRQTSSSHSTLQTSTRPPSGSHTVATSKSPTTTGAGPRALPGSDDIDLRAVIAVAAKPCPQGHAMVNGKCKLIF